MAKPGALEFNTSSGQEKEEEEEEGEGEGEEGESAAQPMASKEVSLMRHLSQRSAQYSNKTVGSPVRSPLATLQQSPCTTSPAHPSPSQHHMHTPSLALLHKPPRGPLQRKMTPILPHGPKFTDIMSPFTTVQGARKGRAPKVNK